MCWTLVCFLIGRLGRIFVSMSSSISLPALHVLTKHVLTPSYATLLVGVMAIRRTRNTRPPTMGWECLVNQVNALQERLPCQVHNRSFRGWPKFQMDCYFWYIWFYKALFKLETILIAFHDLSLEQPLARQSLTNPLDLWRLEDDLAVEDAPSSKRRAWRGRKILLALRNAIATWPAGGDNRNAWSMMLLRDSI